MSAVASHPRLELRSLTKTFGSDRVLSDVHLTVQPGEVHGLVGQNGSGKSTLIKVLTGFHEPDPGASVLIDGRALRLPVRWSEAHRAGVVVVHQDLGLLDGLTVAENVCVGGFPTRRLSGRIDVAARDRIAGAALRRLGADVSPRALCGSLHPAQRAEVAIARALRDQTPGGGLMILDESTRALSGDALSHFHELIGKVAASGTAVLMISHNLPEVVAVTDRVTVLRDGELAASGLPTGEHTDAEIAALMIGRPLSGAGTRRAAPPARSGRPQIAVDELSAPGLSRVSFRLGRGEVVGVTGLPGSGFETIPYLLAAGRPAASGRLSVDGRLVDLTRGDVRASLRAGVVLVPERRDRDGLAMSLSASENVALPSLQRHGRWLVRRGWQRRRYRQHVVALGIRPPAPGKLIKELSGGNQQKVLLAKWMATGPALLVLHEPTQAVDVAAREDLLDAITRTAAEGTSVLLVTAEPSDLAQVCDRVLVLRGTREPEELHAFDPDSIVLAVYGEHAAGHPREVSA